MALPGAWMLYGYWRGTSFYGEVLHATGDLSVYLLIATLAVTPLSLAFPKATWTRWLRVRRRNIGVATFGYALLHTVVYIHRKGDFASIVEDAADAGIWMGWIALAIFLALAITSNNASVRRLGRGWKLLHRSVYVAAALSFGHWIMTAFDPLSGWIHGGVLAAIEGYRIRRSRRHPRPTAKTETGLTIKQ